MQILETVTSTLRGRLKTIAQDSSRKETSERGVNRWVIYKQLCVAKSEFELNDRCLAVLSSLLSFLPEDDLNEKNGLVVFPSNRQLSLRAHGMPESTLRRHLSSLIEAKIIARKDSPTRKRYAHKNKEGNVELAFGFSFAPLLDRASEIAAIADQVANEQKTLRRLRDEVSVLRRDLASIFADAAEETGKLGVRLIEEFNRFRDIVNTIPRRASLSQLVAIKANLEAIRDELTISLKNNSIASEISGSDAQFERRYNESLPESRYKYQNNKKSNLSPLSSGGAASMNLHEHDGRVSALPSLDQVLRTCPDIREYGANGIGTWRELVDASQIVSVFLGISRSAYQEALRYMGQETASAVIAWILHKLGSINSPGGYLRSLTKKAREGTFSISQLLFSEMKAKGNLVLAQC
ncbi:plasmid replication protein RepC [Brucella intermedia]|uniref:plasmid replication protein RepC n=1 Tax=Brucella intermedia TaxID=94625 RepID=UPI0023614FEB|nr:plasmid replication protein RepC [Brucella intermedia]